MISKGRRDVQPGNDDEQSREQGVQADEQVENEQRDGADQRESGRKGGESTIDALFNTYT